MSVSHHLTDETIHDYATGSLSMPMETLVACHLTVCRQCRERALMADGVGGGLFERLEPAPIKVSALDLIARSAEAADSRCSGPVAGEPNRPAVNGASAPAIKGVPRPLARLLPAPLEQLKWRRVAPGIKQYKLDDQHRRHGAFQLLHLAPGAVMSEHSHHDRELTFLVQGSYRDSIGRFQAGDIADLDGSIEHQPVVDSEEPCIALIATQSPVRYSGVIGRIMQPFVGI
ncbi:ChrR family anti-sigma-E factor [Granulosicoccus sp. 3-233]|uniref:ChrR family anti-sigma-E factor n=1 Tax=Granulosicoccus sp. 3-233 TaxID=3417969 RepID=UPI003D331EF7